MIYLFVGLGGVIGALLRYYLGFSINSIEDFTFPIATLVTNYIGCLILGWFTTYVIKNQILHTNLSSAIGTGLLGSFTTFSTFSYETITLIQYSHWGIAIAYVLCSLWGGLALSFLGYKLGELHYRKGTQQREGMEKS